MDPTLQVQFASGWANIVQQGHMRNTLQSYVDHAVLARMMIQGGDASNYADMISASHVPTSQPYVAPNFVGP